MKRNPYEIHIEPNKITIASFYIAGTIFLAAIIYLTYCCLSVMPLWMGVLFLAFLYESFSIINSSIMAQAERDRWRYNWVTHKWVPTYSQQENHHDNR